MLENPFPVPICLFFLSFFSFVLTKTRKEFSRTSKPNVAMQHSREFVLEAHILNIKLTADLQEWQTTFRTRKKESEREGEINQCVFLLMLFSKGTEQDVRPRETGSISGLAELEKSASDLWVIWCIHAKCAAGPGCCCPLDLCLAWAADLGQGGWQAKAGYHHVCTALPSVLATCRCQECFHEPLKSYLWEFSKHRLVRKKSEWLELTPPRIHICIYTHMYMHTSAYIRDGCVGLRFPAGWKTSAELEERK